VYCSQTYSQLSTACLLVHVVNECVVFVDVDLDHLNTTCNAYNVVISRALDLSVYETLTSTCIVVVSFMSLVVCLSF